MTTFDLAGPLPRTRTVIEASAGTGKTYAIAALVARYVAGEITTPGHALTQGIGIDQVLVVTFTRAAASELRDRIRAKLRLALRVLNGMPAPDTDTWLRTLAGDRGKAHSRRVAWVTDALARFDEATITTIHGFCQQALTQAGLRGGDNRAAELTENASGIVAEVCRDLLIRELADDPCALSVDNDGRPIDFVGGPDPATRVVRSNALGRQPHPPDKVERDFVAAVNAVLTNAGATPVPAASIGGVAGRWSALVAEAVAEITARQRERRQIGYDRLVSDLAATLDDPAVGPSLAGQLASRYHVVLVDEFQDTDRLQWGIFERAFGGRPLITVGDPKQAIYRFRGADVQAYLAAIRATSPATLGVNFRSDRGLIDGLGVLFNGATLGHPDIAVRRVEPRTDAPRAAVTEKNDRGKVDRRLSPPIHLRELPDSPEIPHSRHGVEAGAAQRIVLADVAARIRNLLDHGTIEAGAGPRPVEAQDIAVLVPSQRRAADTAAALRTRGIPSVRARTGSVLQSDAAMQWRLLLAGLATPTRARVARAAGLSWFFDLSPAELRSVPLDLEPDAALEDSPLVRLQRELAELAHRLRADGVGPFYEHVRSETRLLDVTLSVPGGDRNLTDCDHIAELLVAELRGEPSEGRHVQEVLDRMIAADADLAGESTMRRIETDSDAVRITTIHAAKGLEFPIVLLPFCYVQRLAASRPYVFNSPDARHVDVASWVTWGDGLDEGEAAKAEAEGRKQAANREVDGDGLRTLYVAMTRAQHRLEVWWAPTQKAGTSALGRLLLDREGAGPIANSAVDDDYCRQLDRIPAQLAALAAASGNIARFAVPLEQPERRPLAIGEPAPEQLAVADGTRRHPLADPTWRRWSFTAVSGAAAGRDAGSSSPPVPTVGGGTDEEPAELAAEVPVTPGTASDLLLADSVGGTTFGTLVHGVLEQLDFTSATLRDELAALTADAVSANGLAGAIDVATLADGLVAAVETPLGPRFGGRALTDLAPADRLAELTFDLRLADGVPAAQIGELLGATLDAGDPLRAYGEELAGALEPVTLAGWLTGSIDAVFRLPGEHPAGRYVVVDYKTNRLPSAPPAAAIEAYRPDRLVEAMAHHHYPLQALLYEVALHRYLRWRLGSGYDPAVHLGGVAYLFVRGMVGPATPSAAGEPYGVFSWQPPTATITSLDTLLGGRR